MERLDYYNQNFDLLAFMPTGWITSFEHALITDLNELIKKYGLTDFKLLDVKEKWGMLRLAATGLTDESLPDYYRIELKYEKKSITTCIVCGNETNNYSYNLPICKVH